MYTVYLIGYIFLSVMQKNLEFWSLLLHLPLVHMLYPLPDVFCILSTTKPSLVHRSKCQNPLRYLRRSCCIKTWPSAF